MAVTVLTTFGAATAVSAEPKLHGTLSSYIDFRAANSTNRQDQDVVTDLDLQYGRVEEDTWAFTFSGRANVDVDGRRPSEEPGIYNGIQETYDNNVVPWLYKAAIEHRLNAGSGPVGLTGVRLGRQYHTDGDFLWFDGLELSGRYLGARGAHFSLFGGVPVRLFESAEGDWLAGASLNVPIERALLGLEAYHVTDKQRFGITRYDDVARASIFAPLSDSITFQGTARIIDDTNFDGRARITVLLPRNAQLRADVRGQSGDRGAQTTELDAASLVLGRSISIPRRAWHEYGGDLLLPLLEHFTLDLGGITHQTSTRNDPNNIEFDRYFASGSLSEVTFLGKPTDASVTFEAYQTKGDWTRTASGEVSMQLSKTFTGSVGTSYALYSYDYNLGVITTDHVRIGTASFLWKATSSVRIDGRYDIEHDGYRLHHFGRLGFRYDF